MKKLFKLRGGPDNVANTADLEWPEVTAILETMSKDKGIDLEKLDIRKKSNGTWRVVVRASRKKK
jgi:hypothetical protein